MDEGIETEEEELQREIDYEEAVELLQGAPVKIEEAEKALRRAIVHARDDCGMSFREIAEHLGRVGYGFVHHLYKRGKAEQK